MKQRVLIVDDSPFVRRIITDWLIASSEFEVVGAARDGIEGVRLAAELKPDIVTMDVEMPRRDGLSALEEIMRKNPLPVLMVSSVTTQGACSTIRALEIGAYDFVTKPSGNSNVGFLSSKEMLLSKLRAAKQVQFKKQRKPLAATHPTKSSSDRLIVIASSTGGPRALTQLWESLPVGFPAPILVVQHLPSGFTSSLAKRLNGIGTVGCEEAHHGSRITSGKALIAPSGSHMRINPLRTIELVPGAPVHGVCPAADYLFASAAAIYGSNCIGVVLTGMGRDGTDGALAIKSHGGIVLAESEESCSIFGMPKAAGEAGAVDGFFAIHEMAAAMVSTLNGRLKLAS